jgi:hypothetical protein
MTELSLAEKHTRDLTVACPQETCGAKVGEECDGPPHGIVHLARRHVWNPRSARISR